MLTTKPRSVAIAHEAPITNIPLVQSLTDFDFAIAHFCKVPGYIEAFSQRKKGRTLIMDNGLFELSSPLSIEEVLLAAEAVNADYVVAPDATKDRKKALEMLKDFSKLNNGRFKIAAVVCGDVSRDAKSRDLVRSYKALKEIEEVSMYMFSFLQNRSIAISTLRNTGELDYKKPHHLLGYHSLGEMKMCLTLLAGMENLSMDTMKPVNVAFHEKRWNFSYRASLRGKFPRPEIDGEVKNTTLLADNINAFRRSLRGER